MNTAVGLAVLNLRPHLEKSDLEIRLQNWKEKIQFRLC